jgi:hypothetical protein
VPARSGADDVHELVIAVAVGSASVQEIGTWLRDL